MISNRTTVPKCLDCELARARWRTLFLKMKGIPPEKIAEKLSQTYGAKYHLVSEPFDHPIQVCIYRQLENGGHKFVTCL